MEYTAEDRKLIANAFKNAKKELARDRVHLLNRGKTMFICNAIINGCGREYNARKAIYIIQSRLGYVKSDSIVLKTGWHIRVGQGHTVETWLYENGYITNIYRDVNIDAIQQYRHRWLDSLIEEFSH